MFKDPSMRLFEYDEKSLLASIPTMLAFPKVSACWMARCFMSEFSQLQDVYKAWKSETSSRGNVTFKLNHEVLAIKTRCTRGADGGPVVIQYRVSDGTFTSETLIANFDEIILAIDADSALKLLGSEASWMERQVLGRVKYLYDVTITHNDLDYMKKVKPCV